MDSPGELTDAAVLVPVYRDGGGDVRVILVRRGEHGVHGGQLAFPGGKREPSDSSFRETALRETWEEIGLVPKAVTILKELPSVATVSTGFRIIPFLGKIRPPAVWRCQEGEVAEILDLSLQTLADTRCRGEELTQLPNRSGTVRVPFLRVGPYKLWGATYRIFYPLLPCLLAGTWDI